MTWVHHTTIPFPVIPIPEAYYPYTYIVYSGSTYYARDWKGNLVDQNSNERTLINALCALLQTDGGVIHLKDPVNTLDQSVPNLDVSGKVIIKGEGRRTNVRPSGYFDPIDVTRVGAQDLVMRDINGVDCDFTYDLNAQGELLHSVPCRRYWFNSPGNDEEYRLLGNLIRHRSLANTYGPVTGTEYALYNGNIPAAPAARPIIIEATVRCIETGKPFYPLFAEPYLGEWNYFLGFRHNGGTGVGSLSCITNDPPGSNSWNINNVDPTLWHVYRIVYQDDFCQFFLDGVSLGTSLANVSTPPHLWFAGEPLNCQTSIYIKRPFISLVNGSMIGRL